MRLKLTECFKLEASAKPNTKWITCFSSVFREEHFGDYGGGSLRIGGDKSDLMQMGLIVEFGDNFEFWSARESKRFEIWVEP